MLGWRPLPASYQSITLLHPCPVVASNVYPYIAST